VCRLARLSRSASAGRIGPHGGGHTSDGVRSRTNGDAVMGLRSS
jgi:hypothetical protein